MCIRDRSIGEQAVKADYIDKNGDIFYFTLAELQSIQRIPKRFLRQRIKQRKIKRDFNDTIINAKIKVDGTEKSLQGIGVSSGITTGRARISMNFNQAMECQKGEILVVPCADPAWTPVFSIADGLIMEKGGLLSHAAIVAREFQLPTVTHIIHATSVIQNGDLLEIDGSKGSVTILETKKQDEE